jgi:hypothetical protein
LLDEDGPAHPRTTTASAESRRTATAVSSAETTTAAPSGHIRAWGVGTGPPAATEAAIVAISRCVENAGWSARASAATKTAEAAIIAGAAATAEAARSANTERVRRFIVTTLPAHAPTTAADADSDAAIRAAKST